VLVFTAEEMMEQSIHQWPKTVKKEQNKKHKGMVHPIMKIQFLELDAPGDHSRDSFPQN